MINRGSLLALFLTVLIDLLGFGMVIPLLPIYAQEFTTDERGIQLGLLMASFSAMQFVFSPIWGRISDRVGRRPIILLGLLGSCLFYLLFAVATVRQSLIWLFVSRIGAGMSGATIAIAQAYIADTTELKERPRGMALIGMAFGLGFTFGPLLGYLALPSGSGNAGPGPGYAAAGLSLVALIVAWRALPESRHRNGTQPVRPGMVHQLREALSVPSIGLILVALFMCVFSFANFESTLSMTMKGKEITGSGFHFSFRDVCLSFAFIGLVLAVVQGGLVRRLSGRISEGRLVTGGALLQIVGFLAMVKAIEWQSVPGLFITLAMVVAGFAFMMPSLQSLLSRRSDPERQGSVLGVGQSVSALARILGPAIGIPLLKQDIAWPYYTAAILMAVGIILVTMADRRGADFQS